MEEEGGGGSCQPGRLLFMPRTSVSYFWQLKKKEEITGKLIRGKLNVFLPILGEKKNSGKQIDIKFIQKY